MPQAVHSWSILKPQMILLMWSYHNYFKQFLSRFVFTKACFVLFRLLLYNSVVSQSPGASSAHYTVSVPCRLVAIFWAEVWKPQGMRGQWQFILQYRHAKKYLINTTTGSYTSGVAVPAIPEQVTYRKISNIWRNKFQNLNISRLVLQLSLLDQLKPVENFKSRMKMYLEQRRQAMLQLHLSDQQFYCPLRCGLLEVWRSITITKQPALTLLHKDSRIQKHLFDEEIHAYWQSTPNDSLANTKSSYRYHAAKHKHWLKIGQL